MKLTRRQKEIVVAGLSHAIANTEGNNAKAAWEYECVRRIFEKSVRQEKP